MGVIVAFLAVLLKPIEFGGEFLLVKMDQEYSKNNKNECTSVRNSASTLCDMGAIVS